MTDGTSQGLFIVVAIVIFGIFVVMAYILFEDTLSPAMANMFTEAIEQSDNKLKNNNMIAISDFELLSTNASVGEISKTNNRIKYTHNGNAYTDGFYITSNFLEKNKEYVFTYDLKLLDGEVSTVGGHTGAIHNPKLFVNGEDSGFYGPGVRYDVKIGEKVKIKVLFNTNSLNDSHINTEFGNGVFIQPNRYYQTHLTGEYDVKTPAFTVEITNIRLVER